MLAVSNRNTRTLHNNPAPQDKPEAQALKQVLAQDMTEELGQNPEAYLLAHHMIKTGQHMEEAVLKSLQVPAPEGLGEN